MDVKHFFVDQYSKKSVMNVKMVEDVQFENVRIEIKKLINKKNNF
jgi:hypothetical protein